MEISKKNSIINRRSYKGKNNPMYGIHRYGKDNPMYGKHHSEKAKEKIKIANSNEKAHNWKGDNVGYGALHTWVRTRKAKPDFCECCKVAKPYDLANISQEYKRDVNDFEWLCHKCHMMKDGVIEMLIKRNKTNHPRKGKKLSKEHIAILMASHKGIPNTQQQKQKIREKMKIIVKNRKRDKKGHFLKHAWNEIKKVN